MRVLADLIGEWTAASDAGALITSKHDPNHPHAQNFHTKVSHEVSSSMGNLLRSGAYEIHEYRKAGHANECWAIVPTSGSFSGSLATAFTGSVPLPGFYDQLLIASGTTSPVHVMGETSASLAANYTYVRRVT